MLRERLLPQSVWTRRFRWRLTATALVLAVCPIVGLTMGWGGDERLRRVPNPRAASGEAPERLVLAFYYTWFDEQSWGPTGCPTSRRPSTYLETAE